jgi:hypothetical protein
MRISAQTKKRIIVSGPVIKYPWGGLTQYWLAWLVGLKELGHDVYYVEDVEWDDACYDISSRVMTNDPHCGIRRLQRELARFGLDDRWGFVDRHQQVHGMGERKMRDVFRTADVFIDLEFDTLNRYACEVPMRILVDGEPGWNQLGMQKMLDQGMALPHYDRHFTLGMNMGTPKWQAPTLGIDWQPMLCPVLLHPASRTLPAAGPAFSTVMKWKANPEVVYEGRSYGMKDREFEKFLTLPSLVGDPMEIVVSGPGIPAEALRANGWIVKDGDQISTSVADYRRYIETSRGEFSVVKNAFVETRCGMFMERSGYYLYSQRPVVLQDNGWSDHLPTGRGLFAVNTVEEAADAIGRIKTDYRRHGQWAHEIAHEYLDARKVLQKMLDAVDRERGAERRYGSGHAPGQHAVHHL